MLCGSLESLAFAAVHQSEIVRLSPLTWVSELPYQGRAADLHSKELASEGLAQRPDASFFYPSNSTVFDIHRLFPHFPQKKNTFSALEAIAEACFGLLGVLRKVQRQF